VITLVEHLFWFFLLLLRGKIDDKARFLGFFPDFFARAISFADLLAVREECIRHECLLGINASAVFRFPAPGVNNEVNTRNEFGGGRPGRWRFSRRLVDSRQATCS
jgi:hypothetical protein